MTTQPQRLLKANTVRGLGSKVVFNYEDIRRRCEEHLDQTRRRSEEILTAAEKRAAEIRQTALAESRETGLQEGLHDAETRIQDRAEELASKIAAEKLQTLLPAMQAAVDQLNEERERWLTVWEETAVRLSLAVAEKLIRRKLNSEPALAVDMVRDTLELAAGTPRLSIRLNPRDLEHLGEQAEQVIRTVASCGEVTLVPDESISPGGCIINTQHGIIDGDLNTQLERIAAELLD